MMAMVSVAAFGWVTMMLPAFAVLAAAAPASEAVPQGGRNGWIVDEGPLNSDVEHTIRLQLRPAAGLGALDAAFTVTSDPAHPQFRQWLTVDEVAALVAPPWGAAGQLAQWARRAAAVSAGGGPDGAAANVELGPTGDYVSVRSSVAGLERALRGVRFCGWRHPRAPRRLIVRRCGADGPRVSPQEVLPAGLAALVEAVFGVDELLPVAHQPAGGAGGDFPGEDIYPRVIAKQYQLRDVGGKAAAMSQGVAAFEDAQFLPSDVAKFQRDQNLTSTPMQVLGPNKGGYFGEASLDTQYIFATGNGVPGWFIAQEAFDMLSWSFKVLNMTLPPKVLSISWGGGESNYPIEVMRAANLEFQKMGLLGISIFAASGDDGTGKQGLLLCKAFDATYPASSPFVTAVGGTYLDKTTQIEHGWADSGGGFSAVFGMPGYQRAAVEGYTPSIPAAATKLYNASGRALPDVAALSTNFQICSNGAYGPLSGTSAATPTFAGMVSIIVDGLLAEDKPSVGFINPVLYAAAARGARLGYDVIDGNNRQLGCPAGFPAVKGWDALSGFGTPIFDSLATILRG